MIILDERIAHTRFLRKNIGAKRLHKIAAIITKPARRDQKNIGNIKSVKLHGTGLVTPGVRVKRRERAAQMTALAQQNFALWLDF